MMAVATFADVAATGRHKPGLFDFDGHGIGAMVAYDLGANTCCDADTAKELTWFCALALGSPRHVRRRAALNLVNSGSDIMVTPNKAIGQASAALECYAPDQAPA